MDLPTDGVKFRIKCLNGASRDVLMADAPSLADLYDDPASNGGEDLLFYTTTTPDYAAVREFWNHVGDDVRILAVVRPRTESAVQAAVRYLTRNNIPLSVCSGGRGAYGQGRADAGGVVVDMRAMDSMELCRDRVVGENDGCSVALVGGGIVGGTLNRWLHSEDLITASGWSSEVGFAGWLCGGGYGFTSNKWGLGADNLVGARVVLASGEVVDTDDKGHTELLWALRGAGNGNVGIVTQLRVKTYPYPGFLAGILAFPLAEANEVLRQFHELTAATPIELHDAMAGESMLFFPPTAIPLFGFQFVWAADKDGSFHNGQTWLNKMRSLGSLALDTVVEQPLHEFQDFIATTAPPSNYHMRTRNTTGAWLGEEVVRILVRHPPPNHNSVVVIHNARGKAVEPHLGASFPIREQHTTYSIVGGTPVETPSDGPEMHLVVDWANALWDAIGVAGLAMEKAYGNFEDPAKMDVAKYYGVETAGRLRAVKKQYDPKDAFYKGYPKLA